MHTKTIAYFRNGLGNFVLFTPALRALASLDESGKVDVCIDSEWNDNRRQALIDTIKALPFVESMINFPAEAITKEYTTYYWTKHTYPSEALNFFRSKEPRFDIGVEWRSSAMHEIDFYMSHIRRHLGFIGETPKQYFPTDVDFAFKKDKLAIGICNGSYGHLRPSKEWPFFPALAETLKNAYDCDIVKIGYENELSDVKAYDYNFVGNLNVLQSAKVISQLDLFVTVDTFNMHVADALNVPMIVIWGGSVLSKNRPVNNTAKILNREIGCQPCHESKRELNCVNFDCLKSLYAGYVVHEIRKILK